MKRNHKRRKWILFPTLLILTLVVVHHWDAIVLRVAPKAILGSSLNQVFEQLEKRFQENPLRILINTLDEESNYTADISMVTDNALLGTIAYDMKLQTSGTLHRIQAEGTATTATNLLDLKLYLDDRFLAVASQDLLNGKYYGITYDTFSKDIRSIPFLNFLVSDRVLEQWDTNIRMIQEQMKRSYVLPSLPKFSDEDLRKLLLGVLAWPCDVQEEFIHVPWATEGVTCQAVHYQANGADVLSILKEAAGIPFDENATAEAVFYLNENTLIKLKLIYRYEGSTMTASVDFGKNPMSDVLFVQIQDQDEIELQEYFITVDTEKSEGRYTETWKIAHADDEGSIYRYDWSPVTGEMRLSGEDTETAYLNFAEIEQGFRIETEDLSALLGEFTKEPVIDISPGICTISVKKGSNTTLPPYQNLDQWSLDDLVILVSGIGSLFGIHIGT